MVSHWSTNCRNLSLSEDWVRNNDNHDNGLGEGAYSQVYKVKRIEDQNIYALKRVKLKNLKEKEIQNAINEVRILASIKHVNVISYKEAFMEPKTHSLW